jgi:hypothetical protein
MSGNKVIENYCKINRFSEGIAETKTNGSEYACEGKSEISYNIQEKQYLQTLSEKEIKAYEIAKKCLGTSFQLKKSNGYLTWACENH